MKMNWRGEPGYRCWMCGSANTVLLDPETRNCNMCGNHYAVHDEEEMTKTEKRPLGVKHVEKLWELTDQIVADLNWTAPEDVGMRRTKIFNKLAVATSPLAMIHGLMNGKEWSPDTLNGIAEVLRRSGFEIEEP